MSNKIFIIDDEESVRASLSALLSEYDYEVEAFESAQAFLNSFGDGKPGCIILDIQMPGMTGLELQDELISRKIFTPIIFVTGQGSIPWSVQAMRQGAVNFLEKPYDESSLIESIKEAMEQDTLNRRIGLNCSDVQNRYNSLTKREKEVVEYLVYGIGDVTNKLIAKEMNISHRTVEEYRSEAMKKMDASSLKELITMVIVCKLTIAQKE